MPARVVVVLAEHDKAVQVAAALASAGYDSTPLADPLTALEILEDGQRIELLVTCSNFSPSQPNGIALARMARLRKPDIRILVVGEPGLAHYMEGLGVFLASPMDAAPIAAKAMELLHEGNGAAQGE